MIKDSENWKKMGEGIFSFSNQIVFFVEGHGVYFQLLGHGHKDDNLVIMKDVEQHEEMNPQPEGRGTFSWILYD